METMTLLILLNVFAIWWKIVKLLDEQSRHHEAVEVLLQEIRDCRKD